MIEVGVAGVGWLLVGFAAVDVFHTVAWSAHGAGPATSLLTGAAARIPTAGRRRIRRSVVGPATLLAVVLAWAVMLLTGFTFVLQADVGSIQEPSSGTAADWSERAYFVGYTLFTLGNGDFAPASTYTRMVTVLANGAGMFFITLSVTYLLPVISASVSSRAFASSAIALGARPQDVVALGWDGKRVALDHHFRDFSGQLSVLAEQHLAYPVLHLFHAPSRTESAPHALEVLDEALTLLDAVEPDAAPSRPTRQQLRSSIQRYIDAHGHDAQEHTVPAAALTLHELRAAGIPLRMTDIEFTSLLDDSDAHRQQVASLVRFAAVDER